jgi:hypothetical protein
MGKDLTWIPPNGFLAAFEPTFCRSLFAMYASLSNN